MRTNGEIERDAQVVETLRRIADALDAIAGTLAAIWKSSNEGESNDCNLRHTERMA